MLYNLIPHAPRPSNNPTKPLFEPHADGMINHVSIDSSGHMTGKQNPLSKATNTS
jgi:hypothetical protein